MPEEDDKRHRCETREWMRRRAQKGPNEGRGWLSGVLADIAKKRGMQAAERLRSDIVEQWQRGNRGAFGDWR